MLRAKALQDDGYFGMIDPERFSREAIKQVGENECWVGQFRVDLLRGSYEIVFGHKCRSHYSGSFARKGAVWAASVPHFDWIACSK